MNDDFPLSEREQRLAMERASRSYIKRIFDAVMADRWDTVISIWVEAKTHGEWMAVAVWAGLPATVKERLRGEQQ